MIDTLTEFFAPFCETHSLQLEVKEVNFPKKKFFSVKISDNNKTEPPRRISCGFFPDDPPSKTEQDMLFLLNHARTLFNPPAL